MMENIKLKNENVVPIGDGFDYYVRSVNWTRRGAEELNALVSCKDFSMIGLNKIRALSTIDLLMRSLKELRNVIEDI